MKKDLTELVFILDRSGSMSGLESDTIGGYNTMLERQKKEPGEAIITTVLFDDKIEFLHERIDLRGIAPITDEEYFVRGSTALLDAVGITINKIGNVQKHAAEDERPEHVMIVITTDGMENSSQEFSYEKVRRMIEHQKRKYGWEFIFIGANIQDYTLPNEILEFMGLKVLNGKIAKPKVNIPITNEPIKSQPFVSKLKRNLPYIISRDIIAVNRIGYVVAI